VITWVNGMELASNRFDHRAYGRGIELGFIAPGQPMGNGLIESFNGKLRDECLTVHWFESLAEANGVIERWQVEYNETRPHSSLGHRAPAVSGAELLGVGPRPQVQDARFPTS